MDKNTQNTNAQDAVSQEQKKYIRMTEAPLKKLIISLAIPSIISMLVTSLYNMVDTYFVGQLGTEATAGVGLIFPVMAIMQAFSFMLGQGSGNYISRTLGARDMKNSETMAATGCVYAVLTGSLILTLGLVFKEGLLFALGARESMVNTLTIHHARQYLSYILLGAPFSMLSFVLNNQMRFQGNAYFSMIGLLSGALLNCLLDPIFIFVLKLEAAGAALATVISQMVSCAVLYVGTLKSDSLKIRLRNFSPRPYFVKWIIIGGLPSLFRQGLASMASLALNTAAAMAVTTALADEAVAAFSIVHKLMMFAFSTALGFSQGFQPICGFNYGAKKYDRVREGYLFAVKVSFAFLTTLAVVGWIFSDGLIGVFRDSPEVIEFGRIALRCQCVTLPLMALICQTNIVYQSIGRVVEATILSLARQGIAFIPVVLILPKLLAPAINGVYLAQPIADICSFAIALPLGIKLIREMKRSSAEILTTQE